MSRLVLFALVMSLTLIVPQAAHSQGKKGKAGGAKLLSTTDGDYAALGKMTQVFGKVLSFNANNGTLQLRVEYQVPDPNYKPKPIKINPNQFRPKNNNNRNNNKFRNNKNNNRNNNKFRNNKNKNRNNKNNGNRNNQQQQRALQAMRAYQQKMAQMQKQRMQMYQKMMQQMAKQRQQGPKMITLAKEFTLSFSKDIQVARVNVPGDYDAKGNFVVPTAAELKKMRHPKLPGYTCKLSDVSYGQAVNLYLGKADPKAKKDKGIGVNLLDPKQQQALPTAAPPANAPTVRGILIVAESTMAAPQQGRKKKK